MAEKKTALGTDIKKVGIVGCGPMGSAYTQVCAQKGYYVVVSEVNNELLEKGLDLIESRLMEDAGKTEVSEQEKDSILARIKGTTNPQDFRDCDLVIESATEKMDVKKKIFTELDDICPRNIVLGTNTSSLSVLDMAMVTTRPDKVVGIHSSPLVTSLVEIIKTIVVSDETIEIAIGFSKSLGVETYVAKDVPGGIISRLIRPIIIGAIRMIETGQATRDDIDKALTKGLGWPLGPLAMADLIGLDQFLNATNVLYEEFKETQYVPPILLKKMVTAGWLGVKTGKGFYEYDK